MTDITIEVDLTGEHPRFWAVTHVALDQLKDS